MGNIKRDAITNSIFKILKANLQNSGYKISLFSSNREMKVGDYVVRIVANSKQKTDGTFKVNRTERAIEIEKSELNQFLFKKLADSGVTGLRPLELNPYDFIVEDAERNEYTVKVITPRKTSVDFI